jgi:uncharacterized protein DUF541
LRNTQHIARLALIVALVLLVVLPGEAFAQFGGPFAPSSEEYGPGITVSGVGFAPLGHRDRATARAVGDARRRAEAIAAALGVSIGEVREVEVNAPFEPRPACEHRQTGRCAPLDALSAVTTFAIAGGPTSSEDAREVKGTGSTNSRIKPPRKTSPSIRHTLRAARLAATPEAAKAARANAEAGASAGGIPLGPLFAVTEPANVYGYEPLLGGFGPGQFCGFVRRGIVRRNSETGEVHVVRTRRVRRCYRPNASVRLDVTYLGA